MFFRFIVIKKQVGNYSGRKEKHKEIIIILGIVNSVW